MLGVDESVNRPNWISLFSGRRHSDTIAAIG